MFGFSKKKDTSLEEYNERYNKILNDDMNKNQDWLYPIMAAVSMGGIDKSMNFPKESGLGSLIVGFYVLVILLITLNFYLDINARSEFMHADDEKKEKAYQDYLCKHKFIGFLGHSAFWIFFASIFLTYIFYVYTQK